MKKPRKPKKGKAPKRPKRSASVQTWKNYDQRYKEFEKREQKKVSDYNSKITAIATAKRTKESLMNKYQNRTRKEFKLKVA